MIKYLLLKVFNMKTIVQSSFALIFALLLIGCTSTNKSEPDFYVYKILTPVEWQQSQGKEYVVLSAIDQSGEFVHLAEAKNYQDIARRFSGGATEAIILKLDPNKLAGDLVKEANPGDPTEYYHLYGGRIPMDAVVSSSVLTL
jgi:uncharacterized protein (DUF952 family)|tara:strand:+ start:533 stop:961 length:429 start_codon:yes stop_codon:yes gene_type:complete